MALTPFGTFGRGFDIMPPFQRDPLFDLMPRLADDFSTLFEPPVSAFMRDTSTIARTAVDVRETPEAFKFIADMPGLKKEEVKVQIEDGNVLAIQGERTREKVEDTDRYHRVERSSGKFMRRFRLPGNTEVEKIAATVENGVLTVTVPKKEVEPQKLEEKKVKDVAVQ